MRWTALTLVFLAASPAAGQVVSPAPDAAAVTVYRFDYAPEPDEDVRLDGLGPLDGLAMIRETRTVDLPAGRSRILFRGVVDTMIPETAAVEGAPGAIVERNQDYNLLTPGALIEAAVGEEVTLVRQPLGGGAETRLRAIVRSGAQGPVLEIAGSLEALGCSHWHERLVFDELPPALTERPTFSIVAEAPRAGRYQMRLSYLATGIAWSADYVARVAPGGQSLDLTGWVTLANQTSASFTDAPTDVVAGTLSRDPETAPPELKPTTLEDNCWPTGVRSRVEEIVQAGYRIPPLAAPPASAVIEEIVVTGAMARQSDLGDYKLYTLPEPTTVAARQTKQVMFLDQRNVPFERIYAYRFDPREDDDPGPDRPAVLLRLRNEAGAGLGKPLPAGAVAVMEPGVGGIPVLAGQRRISDTPVGLPLDVELGLAMDVTVVVRVAEEDSLGDRTELEVEAEFFNDKRIPIVLEYRQAILGDGFRVVRTSRRAGRKNGEPLWTFRLAPGDRARLHYRVAYE